MSSNPSPLDVVRTMYTAMGDRDEDLLRRTLHPEVEWNQCAGFPGGARRRGVDDVLNGVFAGNRALWHDFAAPVHEFVAAGERVVALGHYSGTHSETGKAMRADFAHVYRVEGDRIVRFDQVCDTAPMVEAAS